MSDPFGYRDLAFNPSINNLGDISTVTDRDAIRQSLRNIVDTARGQRVMEPQFGAGIQRFLFEPLDDQTGMELGKIIEANIKSFEPRVRLTAVNVEIDLGQNGYKVDVFYIIRDLQVEDTVRVTLEKL